MSDTKDMEARMAELESRYAFLQDTTDSLNEMVTRQWAEMDRLGKMIKRLDAQLYEMEQQASGPQADRPPPHY